MRVIIQNDYENLSLWAARYIASRIREFEPNENRPFVLGLPTGSSPLGTYAELIRLNREGYVSFANVVTFNMDEYVGLPKDHEQSYYTFMWKNFFNHIDIKKENVHILDGNAKDLEAECAAYEDQDQITHLRYQGDEQQILRQRHEQSTIPCSYRWSEDRNRQQGSHHPGKRPCKGTCLAGNHRRRCKPELDL